jgi:ribose 5-phosphate isomerase A
MDRKKAAAEAAIELVKDGMVVGLGTGSTANYAIEGLGRRVAGGLRIRGVATSKASEELARKVGVPITTLDQVSKVDLTIDGADEVDPRFNLIKGMGGALLREKIVAFASKQEVVIIDDSKLVEVLGAKTPLPVEVVPFGHLQTKDALESLGCKASLKGGSSPFVTDNANLIYECRFAKIEDPEMLEAEIDLIPGVVESGLFIDLATEVVVASVKGVEIRSKK